MCWRNKLQICVFRGEEEIMTITIKGNFANQLSAGQRIRMWVPNASPYDDSKKAKVLKLSKAKKLHVQCLYEQKKNSENPLKDMPSESLRFLFL